MQTLELFPLPQITAPARDVQHLGENNYYPTRHWFAQLVIETYFSDLLESDHVLDVGCGDGVFLDALPDRVRKTGVELNPQLADLARAKGHDVIVGDFCTVSIPETITCALGNVPFEAELIDRLMERLARRFEPGQRAGFILPAYYFQTSHHVHKLRVSWSISVDLIPRDVFTGLSMPLAHAMFIRSSERKLFGLALYDQVRDVLTMHAHVQTTLNSNKTTWKALVREALERRGGTATLSQLYDDIGPKRPSGNPWWKEQVRKCAAMVGTQTAPATWTLAA
jgi:site-specific DNA-methyltransferase (adenine-specific)